jgi:hypothetical protein
LGHVDACGGARGGCSALRGCRAGGGRWWCRSGGCRGCRCRVGRHRRNGVGRGHQRRHFGRRHKGGRWRRFGGRRLRGCFGRRSWRWRWRLRSLFFQQDRLHHRGQFLRHRAVQTGLNGPEQQGMQNHHARHAPKLALGRRLKVGAGVQGSNARWVRAGAQKACILRQNCGNTVKLDAGHFMAWPVLPHRSRAGQIRPAAP